MAVTTAKRGIDDGWFRRATPPSVRRRPVVFFAVRQGQGGRPGDARDLPDGPPDRGHERRRLRAGQSSSLSSSSSSSSSSSRAVVSTRVVRLLGLCVSSSRPARAGDDARLATLRSRELLIRRVVDRTNEPLRRARARRYARHARLARPARIAQVILPAKDIGRKSDIYVMMVSSAHCVAGKGKYVAIVSTTVETNDPKSELEPGIKLLGRVIARFDSVADSYEPTNDSAADKCFISQVHHATRRRDANGRRPGRPTGGRRRQHEPRRRRARRLRDERAVRDSLVASSHRRHTAPATSPALARPRPPRLPPDVRRDLALRHVER